MGASAAYSIRLLKCPFWRAAVLLMQPVAIFRFSPSEGPAYFADWLTSRDVPYEIVAVDAGAPVPTDPSRYSGIGMMGGPMSVNDALPWIDPVCALLRDAIDARVPVIGHCLGGQLLAKAMGATVARARLPEIGWVDVQAETEQGRGWFGGRERFTTFEWHYDDFALPAGAQRILTGAFNPNQAYTLDDRHIGLQCHIEMTAELVDVWCAQAGDELPAVTTAATMSETDLRRSLAVRISALQDVASAVYTRWTRGLAA